MQFWSLKNEELHCETVTQKVTECSRTKPLHNGHGKLFIKNTNAFTITASTFVRDQKFFKADFLLKRVRSGDKNLFSIRKEMCEFLQKK